MAIFPLFKRIAFKMDPERIHDFSIQLFQKNPSLSLLLPKAKVGEKCQQKYQQKYQMSDGHMQWRFPVGLAAGFDKNALALDFLSRLGFGAVEAGTITPKPQVGNPKPRVRRIIAEESLVNSMGFPNQGQIKIMKNLQDGQWQRSCRIGANLGKNKLTSNERTPFDYAVLYEAFAPLSDYLVINISSPNTPGLRALQEKEPFKEICEAVNEKRQKNFKPLYLKISPEVEDKGLRDLIETAKEFNLSGIIATNTSVSHNFGKGGLSGKAIREQAKAAREKVLEMTRETPELSVIGAGGISSFQDAMDFWKKGGSFIQIYTAFIYQGPGFLKNFQKEIDKLLLETGAASLQEFLQDFRRL